eukprot:PhM_4_TR13832/c2_g1_i1/m.15688/K03097/CSNK2A; casein kinase II subunit alpha
MSTSPTSAPPTTTTTTTAAAVCGGGVLENPNGGPPILNHRYAAANKSKPKAFWDYETYEVAWNNMDSYECTARLGRGKYSEVFEAVHTTTDERCVVKVLKPVKKKKIKR